MKKYSQTNKDRPVEQQGGRSGHGKLVPVDLMLTPEMVARLEEIAKDKNISVSEAGSILLEEAVKKRMELEKTVDKMVREAMEKEYNRLAAPLLGYLSRNEGKKQFSN